MLPFEPSFRVFTVGEPLAGAALRWAFRSGGFLVLEEQGPSGEEVLRVIRGGLETRVTRAPQEASAPRRAGSSVALPLRGGIDVEVLAGASRPIDALTAAIGAAAQLTLGRHVDGVVQDLVTGRLLELADLRRLVVEAQVDAAELVVTGAESDREGTRVFTLGATRLAGAELSVGAVARREVPLASRILRLAVAHVASGRALDVPFPVGELEVRMVRLPSGELALVTAAGAPLAFRLAVPPLAPANPAPPLLPEAEPPAAKGNEGMLAMRALRSLLQAIHRPPGVPDAEFTPERRAEELRAADRAACSVLDVLPEHPGALAVRANARLELGEAEEARQLSLRAAAAANSTLTFRLAGRALLLCGAFREAAAAFAALEQEEPLEPGPPVLRALAAIGAGRADAAAALLRKGAQLANDSGDGAIAWALELDASDVERGAPVQAASLATFLQLGDRQVD